MQLLNLGFLNIIVTALAVPFLLATIATASTFWLRPARLNMGLTFLAIFAFGVLGFVTGKVMGNSRDAAVGTVVPAVLTLLGSISVYVIGVKGARVQGPVAAMVLCFALSLFVGSHFGAQLRYEYEVFLGDPRLHASRAALTGELRLAVELKRLSNYVTLRRLEKDFEKKYGLDLSNFDNGLVKPVNPNVPTKLDVK